MGFDIGPIGICRVFKSSAAENTFGIFGVDFGLLSDHHKTEMQFHWPIAD
jgi:hypothetical protein